MFDLLVVDLIQVADKTEQLAGRELGIKVGGIGEIAAGGFSLQRLALQIETRHLY